MSEDLGLLSLTQLQKLHHQNLKPSSASETLMWNTQRPASNDDDSWEVRAFAQDTGSIMGTTWPPRSYTCTFCRREFRSAQALGGHMNVHRRDRARLRQSTPASDPSPSPASTSPLIFPTQEFVAGGGSLCLLYAFPPHGNVFTPAAGNGYLESPSTHLSIAPYAASTTNKTISSSSSAFSFPGMDTSICQSSKAEANAPTNNSNSSSSSSSDRKNKSNHDDPIAEELDLELRLGQRSP